MIPQAEQQMRQLSQQIDKDGFLRTIAITLLSGRLTPFVSMVIAGLIATALIAYLFLHPDENAPTIIGFLGVIGGASIGVGNVGSIFHTYIASKQPAVATPVAAPAAQGASA